MGASDYSAKWTIGVLNVNIQLLTMLAAYFAEGLETLICYHLMD